MMMISLKTKIIYVTNRRLLEHNWKTIKLKIMMMEQNTLVNYITDKNMEKELFIII